MPWQQSTCGVHDAPWSGAGSMGTHVQVSLEVPEALRRARATGRPPGRYHSWFPTAGMRAALCPSPSRTCCT
eukprot:scaffold1113_cov379-Prasinococcus_capsulatus_cf.AAC.5